MTFFVIAHLYFRMNFLTLFSMLEMNYWTIKQILENLNQALIMERFNIQQFCKTCSYINNNFSKKIEFFDLEICTYGYFSLVKSQKETALRCYDFEAAAEFRVIEKKCERILKLKEPMNIEKSEFFYKNKSFSYFFTGSARNDKTVIGILKANNWIVSAL